MALGRKEKTDKWGNGHMEQRTKKITTHTIKNYTQKENYKWECPRMGGGQNGKCKSERTKIELIASTITIKGANLHFPFFINHSNWNEHN